MSLAVLIGILIYRGSSLLDTIGPVSIANTTPQCREEEEDNYLYRLVSKCERAGPVPEGNG